MTHSDAFQFLRDAFEASGVNGYELDFEDNIIRFRGETFTARVISFSGIERLNVYSERCSYYRDEFDNLVAFIHNLRRYN
jgi:hypothetical protein